MIFLAILYQEILRSYGQSQCSECACSLYLCLAPAVEVEVGAEVGVVVGAVVGAPEPEVEPVYLFNTIFNKMLDGPT